MKRFVYQKLIELTNGKASSLLLKSFTTSSLSKHVIHSYKKVFSISDNEWITPQNGFQSLQDFFTRQVVKESRPINTDPNVLTSPVDGTIEYAGKISAEDEYIVKGLRYKLEELLGSKEYAEVFTGGAVFILYLSPANYHRIHSPVNAEVGRQWIFGRTSYPVNKFGLSLGDRPLSKNYRMITELFTKRGKMAFVKVGAMFVNSIHLTNTGDRWKQGEEVGLFRFGSTVIMVVEKDTIELTKKSGLIRMGEEIARFRNDE
ncbi:phosphatidylserine decarboxylase [Jeotgalibacillus marinus]|uniref:phosphatidylserine decarboxylase n=1 Tax=Jeotgalibacillus marinus TaxID=86667 RepID=A0ABV3PZI7_9BACL